MMTATTTTDPRYPIGPFRMPAGALSGAERSEMIEQIAAAPSAVRAAVSGLSESQLDTPYRPGGWTVRQVVHHLADSHMNAYIRFKLALTQDAPRINAYDESKWAEFEDARTMPVEVSLQLLERLHQRWVSTLRGMTPADFRRPLEHPERGRMALDQMLALYAWHGRHHQGHITLVGGQRSAVGSST